MDNQIASSEALLLADALEVSAEHVALMSREPLGDGSVAGFRVDGEQPLTYYVDQSRIALAGEAKSAVPEVRIWMHPNDPHLPALAPVAFEHTAGAVLARLGITEAGGVSIAGYRPGRRAVLRIESAQGALWMKVVRPHRARALVDAHRALETAGVPVPALRGWSPEGLIVMNSAQGVPAAEQLMNTERVLDNVDLLRSQLASVPTSRKCSSITQRMRWYATRDVADIAHVVRDAEQHYDRHSAQRAHLPVHGDLHFGQLFLGERDAIVGVIDVDTFGMGHPADDEGAFIAHAVASALLTEPAARAQVWELADAATQRWGADAATRAVAATHLAGHALAAHDRGEHAMADLLTGCARALLIGSLPSDAGEPKSKNALIQNCDVT